MTFGEGLKELLIESCALDDNIRDTKLSISTLKYFLLHLFLFENQL